jgi:hypothetical protein
MPDPSQNPPPPPIRPTADRPNLSDLSDRGLLKEQALLLREQLDLALVRQLSQSLDQLQSQVTPESAQGEPTTQRPPARKTTEFTLPEQLKSVSGNGDFEILANETKAPRYLIEVLNDLDELAPGATRYEARPAIVAQIVTALNAKTVMPYPFCFNDNPDISEKASPCILKKDHRGRHKDNDDGSWP